MVTKKQFKKSLNKKNKKVNSTKKNKKQYRIKTRLNKLKNVSSGGAASPPLLLLPPKSSDIPNIVTQLEQNNLYTIINNYQESISEKQKSTGIKKKSKKTKKNIILSIDYINFNLYSQLTMYIENLYKSNELSFRNVINTNVKNNYEHILPLTNNDKDNMFLIFDYFKNQMIQFKQLTPEYMGQLFENSFIGGHYKKAYTANTKFNNQLTTFFKYIKDNDIYENYIKNRLSSLREKMNQIISLLNIKPLEEGEFRVLEGTVEIQEFYKTQTIPSFKYALNYLVKDYIHYLFTYKTLYHTILTPKIENETETINWQIVLENILEGLIEEDLKIMKSIFEYLKKVMMNETEIINGSPSDSVITKMGPYPISTMITPHFFPHLTDNIHTIDDQKNLAIIITFFEDLFKYIKEQSNININITQNPKEIENFKAIIEAKEPTDIKDARTAAAAKAHVSLTRQSAVKKTPRLKEEAAKAKAGHSPTNNKKNFQIFNLVTEAAKAEEAADAKQKQQKQKA